MVWIFICFDVHCPILNTICSAFVTFIGILRIEHVSTKARSHLVEPVRPRGILLRRSESLLLKLRADDGAVLDCWRTSDQRLGVIQVSFGDSTDILVGSPALAVGSSGADIAQSAVLVWVGAFVLDGAELTLWMQVLSCWICIFLQVFFAIVSAGLPLWILVLSAGIKLRHFQDRDYWASLSCFVWAMLARRTRLRLEFWCLTNRYILPFAQPFFLWILKPPGLRNATLIRDRAEVLSLTSPRLLWASTWMFLHQLVSSVVRISGPLVFGISRSRLVLSFLSSLDFIFLLQVSFDASMVLILVPGIDSIKLLLPLGAVAEWKVLGVSECTPARARETRCFREDAHLVGAWPFVILIWWIYGLADVVVCHVVQMVVI